MGEVKAKIKYLPNTYEILEKGDYVECAVSNKKIPLEKLCYWNSFKQRFFLFPT